MKTLVKVLLVLLAVSALLVAIGVIWLASGPTPSTEAGSDTALGQFKSAIRSWTEGIASADSDDETLQAAVAANGETADLDAEDAAVYDDEDDAKAAPSTLRQAGTEDPLREAISRELARRRRDVYRELRPLEQKIFRLKNESSGLIPREPSPRASAEAWRKYRDALQAYEASNREIVGEMQQAVAARAKVAAIYDQLKEDSALAARGGAGDLQALAGKYGIQRTP